MSDSYPLYVYSSPEEINLKTVRDKMVGSQVSRLDPGTLLIERSERQLVFVYDYGSVVFVNIGEDLHSELLSQIGLISDPKKFTVESEDFADDDYVLTIGNKAKVGFSSVSIPEWSLEWIQIISELLAQSSALEIIENDVESRLLKSEELTESLKNTSLFRSGRKHLLSFIAEGLSLRHKVTNHLALFNEPEILWDHEALFKMYGTLREHFEFDARLSRVNEMLSLSRDVSELHLELLHSRRTELLEIIIILLIAFEIVFFLYEAL